MEDKMNDKKYNGWSNYETWVVNLWIDNEESSQSHWRDMAAEAYANALPGSYDWETRYEQAVHVLSLWLKSAHEENNPTQGSDVYADLLNSAMCEVNWYEIAEHMIDDVK